MRETPPMAAISQVYLKIIAHTYPGIYKKSTYTALYRCTLHDAEEYHNLDMELFQIHSRQPNQ